MPPLRSKGAGRCVLTIGVLLENLSYHAVTQTIAKTWKAEARASFRVIMSVWVILLRGLVDLLQRISCIDG